MELIETMMKRITGETLFRKSNVRDIPVQRAKSPYTRKKKTDEELIGSLTDKHYNPNGKVEQERVKKLVGNIVNAVMENKEKKESAEIKPFDEPGVKTSVNIISVLDNHCYESGFFTYITDYTTYHSKRQDIITVRVNNGRFFSIKKEESLLKQLKNANSFKVIKKIYNSKLEEIDVRIEDDYEFGALEYDIKDNTFKITFIKNLF